MATKSTTNEAAQQTEPTMRVEVLTNGIVIGDAHHAIGKQMSLPKSKADALAAFNPPAVKIIGID